MQKTSKWSRSLFALSIISTGALFGVVAEFDDYDHSDYQTQLYTEVQTIEHGVDDQGNPTYYKVQNSDKYLYLGPNEVFFNPAGGLRLTGKTNNSTQTLNGNNEYSRIKNWKSVSHSLEWGFFTTVHAPFKGTFFLDGINADVGTELLFSVDESFNQLITITQEMIDQNYFTVDFPALNEGPHLMKVTLKKRSNTNGTKVKNFRLEGEGIQNSYVLRERWRPSALYSAWSSSKTGKDVQAWIMELSSDSPMGHFSPLTTEFGYFGPIFKKNGIAHEINMSIWNSSNNSQVWQKSHLLGVGHPTAKFGSWSHEGTGVKVRNWSIFKNNESKKYVLGLRYKNDPPYRTFYGYFWDEIKEEWTLYSVGRVYNGKELTRLKNTAFVEVPGPSDRQRTGQVPRKVEYRGWVRNSNGEWNDLDKQTIGKTSKILNHKRGLTEDGERFYASTGGFKNYSPRDTKIVIKKDEILERPLYMDEEKLKAFDELPFVPGPISASLNSNGTLSVTFKTRTPNACKVTICYGSSNAVTNIENWEHTATFDLPAGQAEEEKTLQISNVQSAKFVRILVQDENAQMWTFRTLNVETETI